MPVNNFGYEPMLEIGKAFNPPDKQLNQLAQFMTVQHKRIPAGYTYLGQFIDHDMSFDSGNRIAPWNPIAPSCIFNKREPFLNLETIYGFERPANENEPARADLLKANSKSLLKLGDTIAGRFSAEVFAEKDLPRAPESPMALIVDPRNDENLPVAQTQVAFMRFHNAVVEHLGAADTTPTFERARKIVIQHYQWIILKDYLPRIVKKSVLDDVVTGGNQFYFPDPKTPFIPLEFSIAALRAGHSMIRNTYNWNRVFNDDPFSEAFPASLRELTLFTGRGGLGGNKQLISDWLINWNWFYDISSTAQNQKLNLASKFGTKLASSLGSMTESADGATPPFDRKNSLAALDLYRTRALGLPSGQAIARVILGCEERILKPEQIANLLPPGLKYAFSKETPLWFYLLAEAEIEESGQTLGRVGSRIVAETFVELLKLGRPSVFDDDFALVPDFCDADGEFGMPQMLKFLAGGNEDELNPLGIKGSDEE